MLKKFSSFIIILAIVFSMTINVGANNINGTIAINIDDINFVIADEQIRSTSALDGEFAYDSVIVIFTTEASRNNRNFTANDFRDIGAARVEDVTRLSDEEYRFVEPVWVAQDRMETMVRRDMMNRNIIEGHISSATLEAVMQYEEVKRVAETSTLVNVDEFRRTLLITLAEPGRENVLRAIRILEQREDVRYAGPNYIGGAALDSIIPNNPMLGQQWAVNRINLSRAWAVTTGSNAVRVGVIDTGINGNHEGLRNRVNVQLSRDFVGNTNGLVDLNGHGTHVAGIIGAEGNNGIGIAGVNWNVQLVSLTVLTSTGHWGPQGRAAVASAVNHARINNIPILNASIVIGYNNAENQPIRDAVSSFTGLFIQSAGNYNSNTNNPPNPPFPGRYGPRFEGFSNVLVVGSTDQNDNRSIWNPILNSGSNWGSASVHLFAPGSDILSTHQNGYASLSGTSMAAPHVAGVAALVVARYPSLSIAQVRNTILEGVDRLPQLENLAITGGRLNAYNILRRAGSGAPAFIMVTAGPGGTTTGGGMHEYGDIVTLTAIPNVGYDFVGWFEDDIRINGAGSTYSFIAEEFRMLEARFMRQTGSAVPVFIFATAGEGGTITGGGMYFFGNWVELNAIPDAGFVFAGWYENGIRINGHTAYIFVAESFRMLEARFNSL